MPKHAKVSLLAMASVVAQADLVNMTGGALSITWKDCGDASTHSKVTDLEPKSLPLGGSTTVTGTGALDEAISGGTFEIDMKTSIISPKWTGDICQAKTFDLPLGLGSVTWSGLTCPLAAGTIKVPLVVKLSSAIPASMATADISTTAKATNGDNILCLNIHMAKPGQEIHPERVAQIEEIHNTPGVLWKAAAHPRFASQAPGASSDMMGVKGDQKQAVADLMAKGEIVYDASANSNSMIPDSFDSAQQWPHCEKIINDIRDQSNCGCCWAFAGAEAASDRMCIATNGTKMVPLSAQDICFNGGGLMSHGCSGGQIGAPWSYLKKGSWFGGKGAVSGGQYQGSGPFGKGLCSDFSMPHCHHHGPQGDDPYPAEGAPGCPSQSSPSGPKKCDADAVAPHNDFAADKYSFEGNTVTASGEEDMQKAIMAGGPMEVAFTVYSDFENYVSGIYHHVTGGMAGGHAVKVVGWGVEGGVKYWKIANSWNPHWGEKGYFRIKRGNNEGGVEDQAVASAPDAKWSRAGDSAELVV